MKKAITIAMCFALCITLCSCFKTEAAQAVDDLIMTLGEININSGETIVSIEEAVYALTEKEQKQLDNIAILESARNTYNGLLVSQVEEIISAIGEISLGNEEPIINARTAFNELPENLQELVNNKEALISAETAYFKAQVSDIEYAINQIGEVSLSSGSHIAYARMKYDSYDKEIQAAVSNYEMLINAEDAFFKAKVNDIESAINAIGTITLNSGEIIDNARSIYQKYSTEVQSAVTNYSILTTAENTYKELKINNVINLITDIGTVSLNSEDKISAAVIAYENLSQEEQEKIPNSKDLDSAKNKFTTLKRTEQQNELTNALNKLEKTTDKMEGNIWYQGPNRPKYADSRCYITAYIGSAMNNPAISWLRLKIHYTNTDWLFFNKIIIHVDGINYTKNFNYGEVERDNSGYRVWEYIDIRPSADDIDMLWEIANSKETIIRFSGSNYYYEYTVKSSDKKDIKNVLLAYDLLTTPEYQYTTSVQAAILDTIKSKLQSEIWITKDEDLGVSYQYQFKGNNIYVTSGVGSYTISNEGTYFLSDNYITVTYITGATVHIPYIYVNDELTLYSIEK